MAQKEEIIEFIRKYIYADTLDGKLECELHDAGMDSLTYINLVVEAEKYFGIQFEEKMLDFNELNSINLLTEYIYGRIGLND